MGSWNLSKDKAAYDCQGALSFAGALSSGAYFEMFFFRFFVDFSLRSYGGDLGFETSMI